VIALIDYGAGNLTSVRKALAAVGATVLTPARPEELVQASAMIVPGVGHFDRTRALDEDWREAIRDAIGRGAPLLGICVGLQWLFEGSAEAPDVEGLGLFPGVCMRLGEHDGDPSADGRRQAAVGRRLAADEARQENDSDRLPTADSRLPGAPRLPSADSRLPLLLKVPHVGWNSVALPRQSGIMSGVPNGAQVYFTHSYAAPVVEDAAAITTYGAPFTAAVERGQISGVQFHPEKSGEIGLRVLRNWLETL
jgi:imidazole glycerol-phosphate synthase subunit HisH